MKTLERPPAGKTETLKIDRQLGMKLLLQEIVERRDSFDELAHIPWDIVALMKKAGIFRAGTPQKFGGDAMEPARFLELVEQIAVADGSAAWVAAFGSANTYLAALPEATQQKIYATGPDQVFAGGLYPLQDAERVDGGWNVSGRWKFASGCKGADWIGVGIKGEVTDASGARVTTALMALSPAAEVEVVDNWKVVGMQGTGSHDTRVQNKFYADEWTCLRGGKPVIDEPLYRYPALAYQAQVHAACNLGLARAALDLVIDMAGGSRLMPNMARLGDRGYFRTGLARGEAQLRSAHSFFYGAAERAWELVLRGDPIPVQDTNLLRLSAAHAAHAAADVVQQVYRIAGMSAIHRGHRLQQIVRDTMVVTQHAALSESIFESAGAVLAGVDPGPSYP